MLSVTIGPDAAFVLALGGILLIYLEFIRPGGVIPGTLGAAATLSGAYLLSHHSPTHLGLALLAASIILFVADAILETNSALGLAAAACLTAGSLVLFRPPLRFPPVFAVPICVCFSSVTLFLSYAARLARRNKRSNL